MSSEVTLRCRRNLKEDPSTVQPKGIACNGWNKPDDVLLDETPAAKITVGVCGRKIKKPSPGMARSSVIGHIKKTQKRKSGMALCQEKTIAAVGDDIIVGNEATEAADHEEMERLKFENVQFLVRIIYEEKIIGLVAALELRDAQIEDQKRELVDSRINAMLVSTSFVPDASGSENVELGLVHNLSSFSESCTSELKVMVERLPVKVGKGARTELPRR